MMANYYEKLTRIFLMSGNALYHAAAWTRYYGIVTSIGGKSEEEMSRLAGQVLVSALAVPVGSRTEELDELKGKNVRLTSLLGLARMPTRSGLLKDAVRFHIICSSGVPTLSVSSPATFSDCHLPLSSLCITYWKSPSTHLPSATQSHHCSNHYRLMRHIRHTLPSYNVPFYPGYCPSSLKCIRRSKFLTCCPSSHHSRKQD